MRRSLLLENTPPGWNIRVLTQDDFYQYCDEARIVVVDAPLKPDQPGLLVHRDDRPRILINNVLRGSERLFVGFHELAHHWLHPPGIRMFFGRSKQLEIEADIVAAGALIPATMLPHYHPSEIVELYGYAPDLVEFRREVFDCYKI